MQAAAPQGLGEERARRADRAGDLAWLLWLVVRLAPGPCAVWAFVAVFQGLLVPAQLWLTKTLVDALAAQVAGGPAPPGGAGVAVPLGLLAGTLVVGRALDGALPALVATLREAAGPGVRERVLRQAAGLDLAAFEWQPYYDRLTRATADAETRVPAAVGQLLNGLVRGVPAVLGYGVALAAVSPLLLGIVLAGWVPALALFTAGGQAHWNLLSQQTRERRLAAYYAGVLTERDFAKEVRLYRLAPYLRERWAALFWQTRGELRRQALGLGLRQRSSILFSTVASLAGLLWLAGAGLTGATPGEYALLFQALQGLGQGLFGMSSTLKVLAEQAGYAAGLRAFLDLPAEAPLAPALASLLPAPPDSAVATVGRASRPPPASPAGASAGIPIRDGEKGRGAPFPSPLRQGIRLEDVWFTYPGSERPALAGADLRIGAGETVALVGENGAGKTTLVKLLLGLYRPDGGRITFDGVDASAIDPRALRGACSAVFQQFVRYHLTLRENVGLGQVERLDDGPGVAAALARAGAAGLAAALPEGDATLLGPDVGGVDLSGGQWQRVAIARAFFREAQVLVLDEPTAALDPLAELAVFERFAELARGRTAVLISHRLGMARLADRVLVLRQGRVVEAGPHESLARAGGEYAALFEAQARWYA